MFCKDKSSPYVYNMYSKRNDKLQCLREQYARMQRINDRAIDMKMRQVRLRRLFRETEDIREDMPTNGVVGGPKPVPMRRHLLPVEPAIESETESEYWQEKQPPKPTTNKKDGKELSPSKSTESSPTVYSLCYF
ncbi:Hypothetical predicted protein [Drosophila guanche]|uniref:Uncharacterized protein n=1 Tax=Drosophila guanche TaxID=7266 RepID=A0A3B0KCC7_DROGU|nr:Hypothetical predicted protein [Drosophila guanche]